MSTVDSIDSLPPLPVIAGVEFRHCPGHPGYCAGDDGSVWSCRKCERRSLYRLRVKSGEWWKLIPLQNRAGYFTLNLRAGGKSRTRYVHRLILEAFVGPCPPGMQCRHYPDRDQSNNRLGNLRWGTSRENIGDQAVHGTRRIGEKNPSAKLTAEQVREIRRLHASGQPMSSLARRHGVCYTQILHIVRRQQWQHV